MAPDETGKLRGLRGRRSVSALSDGRSSRNCRTRSTSTNWVNFEAATTFITKDDVREKFGVRRDASSHLVVAQRFVEAGYDHLVLINAGPNPEGFLVFFASELAEPLRKLMPPNELRTPRYERIDTKYQRRSRCAANLR